MDIEKEVKKPIKLSKKRQKSSMTKIKGDRTCCGDFQSIKRMFFFLFKMNKFEF